jgi:hypothetical protein
MASSISLMLLITYMNSPNFYNLWPSSVNNKCNEKPLFMRSLLAILDCLFNVIILLN